MPSIALNHLEQPKEDHWRTPQMADELAPFGYDRATIYRKRALAEAGLLSRMELGLLGVSIRHDAEEQRGRPRISCASIAEGLPASRGWP